MFMTEACNYSVYECECRRITYYSLLIILRMVLVYKVAVSCGFISGGRLGFRKGAQWQNRTGKAFNSFNKLGSDSWDPL